MFGLSKVISKSYLEKDQGKFWRVIARRVFSASVEAYQPVERVNPDGSWVELEKCRQKVGGELRARLYLYGDKLIISAVAGVIEVEDPVVLSAEIDEERLGLSICDHLLQFKASMPSVDRSAKSSDWKVFKASGAKSLRKFEEGAWVVTIETMNSAILVNTAPYNSLYRDITVQGAANHGPHSDIGDVVMRSLKAAFVLRENGVI